MGSLRIGRAALMLIATGVLSVPPANAGDAAAGAKLFARCAVCHAVAKDGSNKFGPNLFGVIGRKAGSYSGYNYSPAMKNAGITWTEATLAKYLEHPRQVVAGNKMPFAGVDATQAEDIAAYLATLK